MKNYQRLLLAVVITLQIPFAYFLSGHDLFIRSQKLGVIWLISIYVFILSYYFLGALETKK